ncbi:hypothetical protein M413DRAFT_449876 [Hebeloma cylindrosporum]|uniref:Arrestin-like N-terminal domain-containing protein n=1 Tax=Hebeloma cylindrosporum TaxID=76867 RepID=A0A0C2Y253_HEBCY|nr:hypothetical protein M413DRAFT_449876 [Hebeloma cylindrosporum h7]
MSNEAASSATPTRRRFFFRRPPSNASTTSVASITTTLPEYSDVLPEEQIEADEAPPRLSSASLGDSEPVAPAHQRRPFRPLPPIPLSRSSSTSQMSRPPRYSIISEYIGGDGGGEPHIEHSIPLVGPSKWATLYTFTPESVHGLVHEPRSAKRNIPTFIEGRNVNGMLELDLEGTQTIQQIILTIQGTILTGSLAMEIQRFLLYKHNIWHKSMGDPRQPTQRSDGRLTGSYQFPFSFPFPSHIDNDAYTNVQSIVSPFHLAMDPSGSSASTATPTTRPPVAVQDTKLRSLVPDTTSVQRTPPLPSGNTSEKRPFDLPQTRIPSTTASPGLFYPTPGNFAERNVSVRVQYELLVRIIHGRFRPDSKIHTNIAYLPVLKPLPFSLKRREAYETNALPPGPLQDPEGWFALPKSVIKGQLGGRQVQVDCTLHLATPLCYTRGSLIPCFLTLSSEDSDALSSLSTPTSPFVRLTRRLQHFSPRGGTNSEGRQDSELFAGREDPSSPYTWIVPPAGDSSGKSGSLNSIKHGVGVAKWWVPPKGVLQDTFVRHLEGEIHLESDLHPSSSCPLFVIEYFVEMYPFVSAGFEPEPNTWGDPRMRVVSSSRVEIATSHALDGPILVPFTGPPDAAGRSSGSGSSGSGTSNRLAGESENDQS